METNSNLPYKTEIEEFFNFQLSIKLIKYLKIQNDK
jgi:hypothetical protein